MTLDRDRIRFCDWCRRWERAGGWGPIDLDDTDPGLLAHSICPDCAARVAAGELLPERLAPGAGEVDALLRRGDELERERDRDRLHSGDDPAG
jgi:hypothetical protein